MRNYLIEKGLDSQRVLAECKSTSTEENFLFAKEILVQQGISAQEPVVYVTNAFHCYRGGVYAAMAGFTTAHALPAGIPYAVCSPVTCGKLLPLSITGFSNPHAQGLCNRLWGC